MNVRLNKVLNHEATTNTIEVIVSIYNYASLNSNYNSTEINGHVLLRGKWLENKLSST